MEKTKRQTMNVPGAAAPGKLPGKLSHGDISNDMDGLLTRFSSSQHFWSRISQKLRDNVITEQ